MRLFAGPPDELRARRASDVLALIASSLGLLVVGAVADPEPGYVRILGRVATGTPSLVNGLWQLMSDLSVVFGAALLVAIAVRRRWVVLRDAVVAAGAASLACLVVSRLVEGSWLTAWELGTGPPERFPSTQLAIVASVVMTVRPSVTLPFRRLGHGVLTLTAFALVALGSTLPLGAVAALLVGSSVAAATRMLFGSSDGRPGLDAVVFALNELGVRTVSLGAAERQQAGLFIVDAVDEDGTDLVVKVYGRDAHDTALLMSFARAVWYRGPGVSLRYGRMRQVEHEALLTVLAAQDGVPTDAVVIAGATTQGDAVLVLQRTAALLTQSDDEPELADALWVLLRRLHRRGIAHGRVERDKLITVDGELGIVDFRGGALSSTVEQQRTDQAQALIATLAFTDDERAVGAAVAALGHDGVAGMLPFLQPPALTPSQRADVRAKRVDLDGLRRRAAEAVGTEPPQLQPLRRITVKAVMQVVLPAVALVLVISGVAGLDFDEIVDTLGDAKWWLIVVGVVLAQLPRITQAVSTLGASPVPLPLGPLYALQLAMSYIGIAVPTSAGRVALNIRFFQRHGVPPGGALAAGVVDGVALFITQALLLAALLTFGQFSVDLNLGDAAIAAVPLLLTVVAIVVVIVVVVASIRRWRTAVLSMARRLSVEAIQTVRGIHSPRRLGLLFGGNVGSELLFVLALWAFCRALGAPVGLDELLLISIGVSFLSGVLPIPGGIGVAEGGLTWGLIQVGVPDETAFAAVILYRLSTFYLPPVWGYVSFRWLERHEHL